MVLRSAFPTLPSPPNGIPPPPRTCFKSANSHGDGAPQGRHPRDCRCFWHLKVSILATVVTFGPSCFHRLSKVPTVTGIGSVLIAILKTVVTLGPFIFCHASKIPTVTGIGVALVLYKSSIEPVPPKMEP